jgi:glycerophosphoryl diester phosphodiesterase
MAAFLAAIEHGADMIELDCQLSADGRVVVVHDPTLTRLWGVQRAVEELSWGEISTLSKDGERIPQLADVLDRCPVQIMVDVGSAAIMAMAYAEVRRAGSLERCIFAGSIEGLAWLRAADPTARIALSWDVAELPSDDLLGAIRPEWFNPRYDLASDTVLESMRQRGIGISAWTVDDDQVMSRLLEAGLDAIITNRIAALVGLIDAARPGDDLERELGNPGGPGAGSALC